MVQAVIMAGGEGSRLRPLTCDRPKPMVPMLNKPVMEYAVELLKKHSIFDIGVTLQYMPQEIINYFGDGSGHGVNMQYFVEEQPLGTAGSIKNAAGFIKDTFIVVSGDALTDFDLSEAIRFHKEKRAIATLVLTPVEIPLEYGVVITEKNGQIRSFLEKPGWGEVFSDTVNTGIYILEPEVMEFIPQGQKYDFSKDLFPRLLNQGKPLYGASLTGYWCDIGNLKQYQEAHYAAMDGRVSVTLNGDWRGDKILVGRNCTIDPTAALTGPVMIGDNCHIGQNAIVGPYVVLGNNCKIDQGASLKRSVIWDGSYTGKFSEIRGALLCNQVTVKNRGMVFEGAVIGDRGVIEEDARVRPDTKVWPHKLVEKGSVVENHLIWGTRACRHLFGADGISGQVNVNLTPECAAKLGAVYGAVLGPGAPVLVSADGFGSTRMLKNAVQAGLMSAGASVIDGGDLLTPVHRNAVRALGAAGGMHIKSSQTDPDILHINFFSGDGSTISRDQERKIENLFERDDFQRNSGQSILPVTYMPGLTDSYIQSLFNMVDLDVIRGRRFKVAVSFGGENSKMVIPQIFNGLGCEVVQAVCRQPDLEIKTTAGFLARDVVSHAVMGVVFDRNGEYVSLIDETGRVIDEDLFMTLMSMVILDSSQKPIVAVPVTGSHVVETMAEARQGRVIRTKTAPVAFMKEAAKPEIMAAQGSLNQAVMTFDALSTVVRLLEYMALKNKSLARMVSEIPQFYMTRKRTDCPWTAKGKVMRQLIEETEGSRVELLDGVKVYHDHGWALVLPDPEEPQYHVYSEGYSYEFADSLADFYIEKINQLRNQC